MRCVGADNALPVIHPIVDQGLHSLAGQMPLRFWPAEHQVAYVGVGHDIAYDLLKSDVLGLHRPG